jgi:hypothetical protein
VNQYLIGGVAVAILAGTFYAGGVGPRAELAKFKAETAAAGEKAKAEDAHRQAESVTATRDLEAKHARALTDAIAARDEQWLQHNASGGAAKQPVRQPARVCANDADNRRLSDALDHYRDGTRLAIEQYRGRVGQLVHLCETDAARKADALAEVHEWAMQERKIYQPGPAP